MYAEHQPRIAAYARASAHNLMDVGLFVQATINQQFEIVGHVMGSLRADGRDSKFLSAQKKRAIDALAAHGEELYARVLAYDGSEEALLALFRRIVELPGFGIVKAGFWLQLVLGEVGCMDRHNLRHYGLQANAFSRIPASAEGLTAKLRSYRAVCQAIGAETLWNQWCHMVSLLRPAAFPTAESVSAWHLTCILGEQ